MKDSLQFLKAEKEKSVKNSADWFYWIAALSLVNSLINTFGVTEMNFIIGLGTARLVDELVIIALKNDWNQIIRYIGLAVNTLIASGFWVTGLYANRRYRSAFIVGMIAYALDGLFFLYISDLLSIGFHLFALYSIYRGFKELGNLTAIEREIIDRQISERLSPETAQDTPRDTVHTCSDTKM